MRKNNKYLFIYLTGLLCLMVFGLTCSHTQGMVIHGKSRDYSSRASLLADTGYTVALAGNAFVTSPSTGLGATIASRRGLVNWRAAEAVISTYLRVAAAGRLSVAVRAKSLGVQGSSEVLMRVNGQEKKFQINDPEFSEIAVGEFDVPAGYVKIDLQGFSKAGDSFGELSDILIRSTDTAQRFVYASKPNFYYWARRGPSCHLRYSIPTEEDVSYYYSEVVVPQGEDKQGSYFMANGFAEGYFGFQVNSASERRILFSVWSPFSTDDPKSIPDDQKIKVTRRGNEVQVGEFGNEGAGGQSFWRYNWKAGTTYRFLLKGEPDGAGQTDYTAWFYTPENQQWNLIASFKRPKTDTYLKRFHSFLENFNPESGYLGRRAHYQNQWVRTASGAWLKVSEATFNVDATYDNQQRVDAVGGADAQGFYLRNGGFFKDSVKPFSRFTFENRQPPPTINFDTLP